MHDAPGRLGEVARRLTAPFGARPLTPAQIAAQRAADALPARAVARKWAVLHDLTAGRARLGLSAQSLTVLEALLTFIPETVLAPEAATDLIVFPSNRSLSARARGLSDASLRRHLGALVEAGLVIRRDSPNGKRYARRGQGGQITHAYGFDLAPLVARADEFAGVAEAARAEALAQAVARERASLLRRDCAKLLDALERDGDAAAAIEPLRARYRALLAACPRRPAPADMAALGDGLEALALAVGEALAARQESKNPSASAAQDERHIQSSNPDAPDREVAGEEEQKPPAAPGSAEDRPAAAGSAIRATYPLGSVLDACPQVQDFAPGGIRSWRDLIETAGRVRAMLGISPTAWAAACEAMGEETAAVTVAAILERHERINSPGGYLRTLTERKRAGIYSLGPVLQALRRASLASLSPERRGA
ncbi:plasmid replication protein RepC [Methylobacterium sp. NEAU 140]|uniref:plasmid replication protein RepC n=1 Tax=Methylobacterium sp. NEAU 140 TaxID=3064945 RepID=UPI0027367D87|nr:plasmid replication protein RepC [Methylobacterium sp. NEAU 140]MDP4026099.1 plasmid replication protein RepC [Methylobacterium sp. NEAU 140]